jgi:serine protease Do
VACAIAAGWPAAAEEPFLRRTAAVRAVEKVGPAVVNITTEQIVSAPNPFGSLLGNDPFFERFFRDFSERGGPRSENRRGLGSGVLIDADRHVLTNEHVVARASRILVTLADGREFEASLLGADPNHDLAVLRVETEAQLPWVVPGRSGDLQVGEPVIAIGNPFGLSNTVTTGVISALDRSLRSGGHAYHGFLQTDASINPGNSGGPLLNAHGELVGINTAIYRGADGIGFAIPIDAARRVVGELIEHGEVLPVWLGLQFQDLEPGLRDALGLPERTSGALIGDVRAGGPAAAGGVQRGDVVTHVDGRPVQSARAFYEILALTTAGQRLRLTIVRDGAETSARVTARAIPAELVDDLTLSLLGLTLESHPQGGFAIASIAGGGSAERIGLQTGDRVLRINGQPLNDPEALRRSVLDLRGRARAILVVARGFGRYHVTIPLA